MTTPIVVPPRPKKPGSSVLDLLPARAPAALAKYHEALAAWESESRGAYQRQLGERIRALFEHYEITGDDPNDPDRWSDLALRLAFDFVPGFQIAEPASKGGRPSDWNPVRLIHLYCAVVVEKDHRTRKKLPASDMDICRILSRRKAWAEYGEKVLYNRFVEARAGRLPKAFQNAAGAGGPDIAELCRSWLDAMMPAEDSLARKPRALLK